MHKILILLLYYERPFLVRNALNSILKADKLYQNWHLAALDDNSKTPLKAIVEEMMPNHLHKVTFKTSDSTPDEKIVKGSRIGGLMNEAIREIDHDIAVMLCDDDELYPSYLQCLDYRYTRNPTILTYHSWVIPYNPLLETSSRCIQDFASHWNKHVSPINCSCSVDASQVSWRRKCCTEFGVWFPERAHACQDAAFYGEMYRRLGNTPWGEMIGQYKGIHNLRLGIVATDAWRMPSIDRAYPFTPVAVSNEHDLEDIRCIRNEARLFMTRHTSAISKEEQLKWWYSLDRNTCSLYAYHYDDEVVGYGLIANQDKKSWLTGALKPRFRNRGFGTYAFRHMIDVAPYTPWLEVLTSNENAQKVYTKLGFTVVANKDHKLIMRLARGQL